MYIYVYTGTYIHIYMGNRQSVDVKKQTLMCLLRVRACLWPSGPRYPILNFRVRFVAAMLNGAACEATLVFVLCMLPRGQAEREQMLEECARPVQAAMQLLWQMIPSYAGARLRVNIRSIGDLMASVIAAVEYPDSPPEWVSTDFTSPVRPTDHASLRELVRNREDSETFEVIKAGVRALQDHLSLFQYPDLDEPINDIIGFAGDVLLVHMGDKRLQRKIERRPSAAS